MTETPTGSWLEHDMERQREVLRGALARRFQIEQIVREARARGITRWIVTGCGDSLFAGMCAEYWFAAGGAALTAIHALEFSRYLYRAIDDRTAVIAISYSGSTARVVEAATAARTRGGMVIAITTNGGSPLAAGADRVVPNDAAGDRSNCGTGNFQAAALLLRSVAAAQSGPAGPLHPPFGLPAAVDALVRSSDAPVRRIVDALPDDLNFTVIGGGYAYPMAHYGAAKLYEAATIPAHVSELEQFVHCEIFPVTRQSCVLLLAPLGASTSRAREIAHGLRQLEAITIAITDDPVLAGQCTHAIRLPNGWPENSLPFLAAVPLQQFALRWALRLGENPDLVNNKWVNRPLIERSETWDAGAYRPRP